MRNRKHASVALPDNVFQVKKRDKSGAIKKVYNFYQERRGRPDRGPLIRLPDELHDPLFWQRYNEIRSGRSGPVDGSFDAIIPIYKASPRYTKRAESTREVYDVCLNQISRAWGPLPIRDLLPKHVYALMDQYADRPSMANMIVAVLSNLLKEAIRKDWCTINIARDIDKAEEAGVGSEPWPEAVYSFVLQHAPPLLMRAAVLGRATGQRAVDLVKMRPADRDAEGIKLFVKKLDGERHWVPMTGEAVAAIDSWCEETMLPYLHVGGRRLNEDQLRLAWKRFRAEHPDKIPADVTLHDLRSMAVCDRRIAGVPHQQISDQLLMSLQRVMSYSKHIDRALNARAGMKVMERPENDVLKTIYSAIENRKS